MSRRVELQLKLKEILGIDDVYFQKPESKKMSYPAVVYTKSKVKNTFANNNFYSQRIAYDLTVMDFDPDSEIFTKVSQLPTASFVRRYSADGLNHEIYTIYY